MDLALPVGLIVPALVALRALWLLPNRGPGAVETGRAETGVGPEHAAAGSPSRAARAALVGLMLTAGLAGCHVAARTGNQVPPATNPPAGSVAPTTSTTRPLVTTTTTTTTEPVRQVLSLGSSGPEVVKLQQRLSALGYWTGTTTGYFGDSTQQAVYALQKAAGIDRDGVVGPMTEAALAQAVVPRARSNSGSVVEVDLARGLLMMVSDGTVKLTLNTSTGGGYVYRDNGVSAVADTPVGHFRLYRQVDGLVVDSLGQLWRPKFFDGGFAIHGDAYVPPYPVSHGCVRVSNEAIDWIWSQNLLPIGTTVWIY